MGGITVCGRGLFQRPGLGPGSDDRFLFLFLERLHHVLALALTIGICFGIYSSVLVMAPIVRWLGIRREDMVKPLKEKKQEAVI